MASQSPVKLELNWKFLLSDSEKLAVLFVNFPFCYVLRNVSTIAVTLSCNLDQF
jgi:hypothetical protein